MVHKWIKSIVLSFIKLAHADTVIVVKEYIINHPSVKLSFSNICMITALSKPLQYLEILSINKMQKKHSKSTVILLYLSRFQNFYEDVFKQMSQYGEIQDMIVVDNLGDHLVGNVYVKYTDQDYAEIAQKNINGRFFGGKKINAVFSPVTDFMNAKCKQHIDGSCKRGGYCNYMHVKPLSKSFKRQLFTQMYLQHPQYKQPKRQSSSQDDFRRYNRRNRKGGDRQRRDRDRRDKRDRRSRSKQKRGRDQRRKQRRSRSSSRDSSLDRKFMIDQWNKDYYKN